tara:strand:+ start:1342 stop:1533 length:192 start_codon:yes stop_codon:yes gene_type:complete
MLLVDFREIVHHDRLKINGFSYYCVIKYKAKKYYFINDSKEGCLLDFIEELTNEDCYVDELEP